MHSSGNQTIFRHPIGVIHGLHDRVVVIEGVVKFAQQIPGRWLVEVDTAGQLLLLREADFAFCALDTNINKPIVVALGRSCHGL